MALACRSGVLAYMRRSGPCHQLQSHKQLQLATACERTLLLQDLLNIDGQLTYVTAWACITELTNSRGVVIAGADA